MLGRALEACLEHLFLKFVVFVLCFGDECTILFFLFFFFVVVVQPASGIAAPKSGKCLKVFFLNMSGSI